MAGKKGKRTLENIYSTAEDGIGFLKKNVKPLFFSNLRITLLVMVVGLVVLLIGGALVASVLYLGPDWSDIAVLALIVLLALVFFFVFMWLSASANLVSYHMAESYVEKGGPVAIVDKFRKNFDPVFRYLVVNYAIVAVVVGLPLLLLAAMLLPSLSSSVSGERSVVGIWLGAMFYILLLLLFFLAFFLVFRYFSQFWLWELLIRKKGAIEALKASISAVKNNLLETFVFFILFIIWGAVVSIPFTILNSFMRVFMQLAVLTESFETAMAAAIIFVVGMVILAVLNAALVATLTLPFQYIFWKKIRPAG